jgi:hypothetical protein
MRCSTLLVWPYYMRIILLLLLLLLLLLPDSCIARVAYLEIAHQAAASGGRHYGQEIESGIVCPGCERYSI